MFSFDIFPETSLRTEAAAYPCGVCPPGAPCWPPIPPEEDIDPGY